MNSFNASKYRPFPLMIRPERKWPNQVITRAPQWCSVDLRDGNQALMDPMTPEQKMKMFLLLIKVGFTQIEVGFPAASQTDFDFVRELIETDSVPDNVIIQVLTQARKPLIERTFAALKGAKKAIVHVYNSTSVVQRKKVFKASKEAIMQIAVDGATWVKECAQLQSETQWQFQYSPESFTGTEVDFAVNVCQAVKAVWQDATQEKIIFNLPATVEVSTPNIYADQVEYFCDSIGDRDKIIVSLHTHNDRGCGVAASELGLMAGADRVEGTLLGNGERTGNLDIVIMAMNMYSQGIHPQLDFSAMDEIIHVVEQCTAIKVHPRQPYAGELVFAAFSGSHQDAINKCLQQQESGQPWDVAYLPIDPRDIGRDYQEVIRINSQSGKGGVAYILKSEQGIDIPRWMQVDFSKVVQKAAESCQTEIDSATIWQLFQQTYLDTGNALTMHSYQVSRADSLDSLCATLNTQQGLIEVQGEGQGSLQAFVAALGAYLGYSIAVLDYSEHTLGNNEGAEAMAYVQISVQQKRFCAAGKSRDILGATLNAVLNAVTRFI